MIRKFYFMISMISFIILLLANEMVYANQVNTPPSFEEKFTEVGYKPVKDAVKEFENHFKQDVKFPKIKPSLSFTHEFGRFYEDKEYDTNDFLSIHFVNEKSPENNYKIDIRPLKNKLVFKNSGNQKVYTLKNGQEAIYLNDHIMNFLVFEKDNWQYMLGLDKKVSNKITPENLVQIANSIE
ncbi:hypothetical protein [Bacillus rubiinfantis]|uniref:hypothetical protein n=1 Tax=Bacillus rubiinfantis TaxID=1499680 RepID=UPI0005A80020|nr:hypothetical protein [Bacillus rubiinfantis]